MTDNNLHIYTGEGKGKTTAAMGLALRSLGHGNKVLIAQFMKNGISGELEAFKAFPKALIKTAPPIKGFVSKMDEDLRNETARQQRTFAVETIELIRAEHPQTIILDEINVAISTGMLERETAEKLIDTALKSGETAATGRNAPEWLMNRADYVSRIVPEKHPFKTRNQPARKGVEW